MTSALSATARHLRLVDEDAPPGEAPPQEPGGPTPVVGYVVLVPEGTDPTELFTADGTRVRFRALLPSDASEQPPAQRQSAEQSTEQRIGDGAADGLLVDPERHTAQADGVQLDLTYLEFELLAHFVKHPHRVHTRAHLVSALWGYSHVGDGRTVDVHVARLRRKLGRFRDTVVTVRRVGYKYEPGRAR